MAKLILILVGILLLVLWFKRQARKRHGDADEAPPAAAAEDMVRCQVCGVNLPRSEAILSRSRFYCCEEHRARDAG